MGLIYLTGMPGSGKTAVGRALAVQLSKKFCDLDEEVVRWQRKTIAEVFEQEGEAVFRGYETEALFRASASVCHVIALGGGTLIRDENFDHVRGTGTLVFLAVPMNLLIERLRSQSGRPLLHGAVTRPELEARIEELWEARKTRFLFADILVFCGVTRSPEQIAVEIAQRYAER